MGDDFQAYKSNPTPDALIRLLRATQDRVYRLCFQLLRNAQDSEDAAQDVLVKIASGARALDDSAAFHRWVYRVSLNGALEAARKAARRRVHESRAAMKDAPKEPLDAETRQALFEGMAKLDDHPRGLLLDHYFEGETLESIATREGVSCQAVSKRLERAREDLRRALPASMAAAFDLSRLFDRAVVPPSVPDLVKGDVLGRVAGMAGGGIMAAKPAMAVLGVLAAALLLAIGAVHSIVTPPNPDDVSKAVQAIRTPDPGEVVIPDGARESPALTATSHPSTVAPLKKSPLQDRLPQFKEWWYAIERERDDVKEDHDRYAAYRKRRDEEHWERVKGLRELIVQDPEYFLAFLRDPDHASVIGDLTRTHLLEQTDRPLVWQHRPFQDYPPELMNGLLELLQSGMDAQRIAALNLVAEMEDAPAHFKNLYVSLLDERNEELQQKGISLVTRMMPMTPALFSKLAAMGNNSESLFVRLRVISSVAMLPGAEADSFVLHRLSVATHQNELMQIFLSLGSRYRARRVPEENLFEALSDAIARKEPFYLHYMMPVATYLSADRLKPVLQQAMTRAKEDWYRDRIAKAVERIDQGAYTRDELMSILDPR